VGWHRLLHSSRVGRVDTTGMAADVADNASHGARSTDHIVLDTVDIVEFHRNRDCRKRDRTSVRLLLEYSKQTKPAAV
jgi:hypothetical protein